MPPFSRSLRHYSSTIARCCTIFKLSDVEECHDLENLVRRRSRSFEIEIAPINRSCMSSVPIDVPQ